jgi:transcriptional regulator with GAF, ATPase, and Fis domain
VLRGAAIGIIVYSVVVLIHANLTPDLGIRAVWPWVAWAEEPVAGTRPAVGDRIVSIAGEEINSLPRYVRTIKSLSDAARFSPEPGLSVDRLSSFESPATEIDSVRYVRVVFDSGPDAPRRFQAWYAVRDFPWQKSAVSIVWFAMESAIFWIGWLVFRRRSEDDAAAMFFLTCIVTVGAYMGGYHWQQIAVSPALTFVFALCAMALPQVSLHFYLMFPQPKTWITRYPRLTLAAIYGLPAILQITILWTIGSVVSRFRHHSPPEDINDQLLLLRWLIWVYVALGATMFLGCLAALVHSYRTARQSIQRSQASSLLLGALLAGAFAGYAIWFALARPVEFAVGQANWALFAASFVFTCAYAVSILRYRLMLAEELLQRGVVYLLVSFAAGLCYYGLLVLAVWFSPRLAADTTHGQAVLISVFIILVLLVLSALRTRFQSALDRRFYREKWQIERAMRRMDETVGKLFDRRTVAQKSLAVIGETLNASYAAVYQRSSGGFDRVEQWGAPEFPKRLPDSHELTALLVDGKLLQAQAGPVLPGDAATPILRKLGADLAHPLLADRDLLGFVLLGSKDDGVYRSEDLGFLIGAADLAGMALRTAEAQVTLEKLNEDLRQKVERLSRQHVRLLADRSTREPAAAAATNEPVAGFESIRGSSPAVREMIETARRVASSQATVLIRGESGTGKSLLAEMIHRNSPRAAGPFVKVHCAALSSGVLESELFGHVKGAFTGAIRDKVGRFQLAHRGTLFLDEVGDISLDVQTKLLRVLQEMTFEPVGSSKSVEVDVRLIAATNQSLEELIQRGRFREDLFYRLNVISLRTPALRERREDVVALASHFAQEFAARSGKHVDGIDDEAMEELLAYDWPGNIRELENVMERAVVLAVGTAITVADLPEELLNGSGCSPATGAVLAHAANPTMETPHRLTEELCGLERARLLDALTEAKGNKSKAARRLGLPRSTFCSKLKRHAVE